MCSGTVPVVGRSPGGEIPGYSRSRTHRLGGRTVYRTPDNCALCGGVIDEQPREGATWIFCCRGCETVAATLEDAPVGPEEESAPQPSDQGSDTGGCNSFIHQSLLSAETDPFHLDSQFEFSRTYSHQYEESSGPGSATGGPDDPGTTRTFLHVDGMHNPTCEQFLESRATGCDGVSGASASYVTETVRVDHDPETITPEELCARLTTVGYKATPMDPGSEDRTGDSTGVAETRNERRARRDMDEMLGFRYIAGVVFGTFMLLPYVVVLYPVYVSSTFGISIGPFDQVTGVADTVVLLPLFLIVSGVVLFFSGFPVLRGAYVSLKTRTANTDLLVTVTITSAYLYGMVALLAGRLDVYFDLTIVIAATVVAAILYESLMKQRAVEQLTDLTVSQVGEARLLDADGSSESVPVGDVDPGDRVLVTQGERIPVDGTLRGDHCRIDEAVVTGESLPVRKEPGNPVVGGSVVTEGAAVVEVGPDATSSIDRLTESVWDLHSATHGLQRRVDRLAGYLVPVVLGGGLAAAAATLALGYRPVLAVLAFTAGVFVLSPWGVGLATPLSVATNIRDALSEGVVVFDETVLERIRETDVVVFDKTGTLTRGTMRVVNADAPPELLAAVAELERRASHPAAEAIANSFTTDPSGDARTDGGTEPDRSATAGPPNVVGFDTHATGVSGTVDGTEVLVGHPDLFVEEGWELPESIQEQVEGERAGSRLPVVVGQDGVAEGLIVLDDQPRAEWQRTLDRLADRNVEAVVLTGDDEQSADRFADHSAVRNVFAGVPPAGKTETVRALQAGSDHVTMVGDGTNDAPALAQADLGVALGSGTALASDAADLAIVDDDLTAIETVFDLATAARKRVARNTGLALLYNAVVLPFAAVGMLNPLVTLAGVALSAGSLGLNVSRPLLNE